MPRTVHDEHRKQNIPAERLLKGAVLVVVRLLKHAAPDTWNRATTQLELKGRPGHAVFWCLRSGSKHKARRWLKLSQHELSDDAQLRAAAPQSVPG